MQHIKNTAQTISVFVQNNQTKNDNFKDHGPKPHVLLVVVKVKQINTIDVKKLLK